MQLPPDLAVGLWSGHAAAGRPHCCCAPGACHRRYVQGRWAAPCPARQASGGVHLRWLQAGWRSLLPPDWGCTGSTWTVTLLAWR